MVRDIYHIDVFAVAAKLINNASFRIAFIGLREKIRLFFDKVYNLAGLLRRDLL